MRRDRWWYKEKIEGASETGGRKRGSSELLDVVHLGKVALLLVLDRGGLDVGAEELAGNVSGLGSDGEGVALLSPDVDSEGANDEEGGDVEPERDSVVEGVGDGSLGGRVDGSSRDTDDKDGSGSSRVVAEVLSTSDEDLQ